LVEAHVLCLSAEKPRETARLNLDVHIRELIELPAIDSVLGDDVLQLACDL
jgi:hypothetical protein